MLSIKSLDKPVYAENLPLFFNFPRNLKKSSPSFDAMIRFAKKITDYSIELILFKDKGGQPAFIYSQSPCIVARALNFLNASGMRLNMGFDLFDEVRLGLCAYELVHYFASLDEQDGGDAGDPIVDGQLRVMVDIHFAYIDLSMIFFGQFFDHRSDSAARAAPFRPEIHYRQFI
jgi:hypothetical protein